MSKFEFYIFAPSSSSIAKKTFFFCANHRWSFSLHVSLVLPYAAVYYTGTSASGKLALGLMYLVTSLRD
jgi:hypothetical protein